MKWMIVAVMAFTYPDGSKDYYLWPEPYFDSREQCKAFGGPRLPMLKNKLYEVYGPDNEIEMISCVDMNVVNDILSKDLLNKN